MTRSSAIIEARPADSSAMAFKSDLIVQPPANLGQQRPQASVSRFERYRKTKTACDIPQWPAQHAAGGGSRLRDRCRSPLELHDPNPDLIQQMLQHLRLTKTRRSRRGTDPHLVLTEQHQVDQFLRQQRRNGRSPPIGRRLLLCWDPVGSDRKSVLGRLVQADEYVQADAM